MQCEMTWPGQNTTLLTSEIRCHRIPHSTWAIILAYSNIRGFPLQYDAPQLARLRVPSRTSRASPCLCTRLCMVSVKLPAHDAHGGGQSQGGSRHGGEGPCHEARVLYLHVLTSISSPGMVRTWSWPPCLPCPRRKTAIRPTPWQRVWQCLMCRKPVFQMPYQGCTYVHTRHDIRDMTDRHGIVPKLPRLVLGAVHVTSNVAVVVRLSAPEQLPTTTTSFPVYPTAPRAYATSIHEAPTNSSPCKP